ncbi:MBL fold metallo-hydrolase [Geodermatophilus sabuli]|uniref:MBL fold metallo-hydrolase n=1 Tax=Geodermatophilus sabuli TaxID=1564158 RepID=A0A7K3W904_9ACTN|nr:MBL fold metallo-hydrolase [Geodermatophilus sabuli]NEK60377.1 MBL fold metallo-hydrolase [Geodermatophilus sabuli]
MDLPYQASDDVHVLPANLTLPGLGVLPINAFLLMAEQPVLVDTGLGVDADEFVAAVGSVIDPREIRWLWLTHDDADHTGNIARIMELAPNARLVTHGFAALRMSTWWPVPMDRVHAIRPGDDLHVGDRTLTAVAPPLFDNPMSIGALDRSTGALFSVDAFGAILPEPTQSASDVPPEALAGGMLGWALSDSPWVHLTEPAGFGQVLDRVRRIQPRRIFSSHLPAADGTSLEEFLTVLQQVPAAEPDIPPDAEQFAQMVEALTADQRAGVPVPRTAVEPQPSPAGQARQG